MQVAMISVMIFSTIQDYTFYWSFFCYYCFRWSYFWRTIQQMRLLISPIFFFWERKAEAENSFTEMDFDQEMVYSMVFLSCEFEMELICTGDISRILAWRSSGWSGSLPRGISTISTSKSLCHLPCPTSNASRSPIFSSISSCNLIKYSTTAPLNAHLLLCSCFSLCPLPLPMAIFRSYLLILQFLSQATTQNPGATNKILCKSSTFMFVCRHQRIFLRRSSKKMGFLDLCSVMKVMLRSRQETFYRRRCCRKPMGRERVGGSRWEKRWRREGARRSCSVGIGGLGGMMVVVYGWVGGIRSCYDGTACLVFFLCQSTTVSQSSVIQLCVSLFLTSLLICRVCESTSATSYLTCLWWRSLARGWSCCLLSEAVAMSLAWLSLCGLECMLLVVFVVFESVIKLQQQNPRKRKWFLNIGLEMVCAQFQDKRICDVISVIGCWLARSWLLLLLFMMRLATRHIKRHQLPPIPQLLITLLIEKLHGAGEAGLQRRPIHLKNPHNNPPNQRRKHMIILPRIHPLQSFHHPLNSLIEHIIQSHRYPTKQIQHYLVVHWGFVTPDIIPTRKASEEVVERGPTEELCEEDAGEFVEEDELAEVLGVLEGHFQDLFEVVMVQLFEQDGHYQGVDEADFAAVVEAVAQAFERWQEG